MDIFAELAEISRLIESADFLNSVRESVAKVRTQGSIVTDGKHQSGGDGYDAVVRCGSEAEDVARRLRCDFPDARVAMITSSVLGVNRKRRGK